MLGFEFLNPLMLWGTALAALPLVIHLFNRKRARPHPFAAIDFVLRSRRRTARRLRLKRILLYAVRTLFFLLIPLALARPQPQRADTPQSAPRGPTATAIVLDTSLSMSYVLDGQSLFDRAKDMAKDALANLSGEDPVTLVVCTPDAPPPLAPGFDRGKIRDGISDAQQTFLPEDLSGCLSRAARALGESPVAGKRILLATDLTAAAFHLDLPAPTVQSPAGEVHPEVVVLDAARGEKELPNLAVTNLRVEPAVAVGNRAFQFTFTVANHTTQPVKDLQATLRVGEQVVAKGFVDIPARGTSSKSLTYRFPSGGTFTGAVELAHDGLTADDGRFFALKVPKDVKALVVNGSPQPLRFMDETFFVEAALTAPGSPVHPVVRDPDTAANEKLDDYDLVMLHNVRALAPSKVEELKAFVKNGGGLFISLGDQVDADAWNAAFGDLLPRKLRLVKTAVERNSEDAERLAARFANVQFDHPALSVFTGDAQEGMLAARTFKYFLLEPGETKDVTQLAAYDDGSPALLEARRGRGRVLLYTSTVDRDWSDWAIRTSFLPATQRMAGWLAGALEERALSQTLVGEPHVLEPAPGVELASVKTGNRDVKLEQTPEGKPVVSATFTPGLYQVAAKQGGATGPAPELAFAVNVDSRESDLTRLDERELKAYFGENTRTERGGGKDEDAAPEWPAWSVLLAGAVALFFVEGLLVRK